MPRRDLGGEAPGVVDGNVDVPDGRNAEAGVGVLAELEHRDFVAGKFDGAAFENVGRDIQKLDLPVADNVHAPLIADFVDAVLNDREPAVTLTESTKTNVLLDAVYESAETGREIIL